MHVYNVMIFQCILWKDDPLNRGKESCQGRRERWWSECQEQIIKVLRCIFDLQRIHLWGVDDIITFEDNCSSSIHSVIWKIIQEHGSIGRKEDTYDFLSLYFNPPFGNGLGNKGKHETQWEISHQYNDNFSNATTTLMKLVYSCINYLRRKITMK